MEDRFRESSFEIFGRIEGWDDIPVSIAERMKAPAALSWIELRGFKANVMAAEERTVLLPSKEKRFE